MSACICNSYEIQIEDEKIPFFDPENKCLRRSDGKKFRYMYFGCPKHKGKTYYKTPSDKEGIAAADKL